MLKLFRMFRSTAALIMHGYMSLDVPALSYRSFLLCTGWLGRWIRSFRQTPWPVTTIDTCMIFFIFFMKMNK